MKYLAFDCSSENVYVGVHNGKEYFNTTLKDMSGTENIIIAINDCLHNAGIKFEDIECLGVCVGPGSWTGCRVAVVTAMGLLCGAKKQPKLVKFTSFDMLNCNNAIKLVKAYASFVFAEINGEMMCIEKSEFLEKYGSLQSASSVLIFDDTKLVEPNIKSAVEQKIDAGEFVLIEDLEPLYLRASQAEIQLKQKSEKK